MIHLNHGLFLYWGNNYWKEYSFRLVMRRSVETNSSSLHAWHHNDWLLLLQLYWNFCGSIGKGYESADDWAHSLLGFII
jgi:hypothetical protein